MDNNFWTSVFGWSSGKTDKFMEWFGRRQSQMWGKTGAVWVDTDRPYELYLSIPELRTIINKRALMISSGIPKLVDLDGNEVNEHPWVYNLINKPNPTQSWSDVIYSLAVNDGLYNNSFAYAPKRSFDFHDLIVPIPSHKVKIVLTGTLLDQIDIKGIIEKFEFWYTNEKKEIIEVENMVYLNTPDGVNLINPNNRIDTLKYPLSNIKAGYHKRNVLLENMGAIGILSSTKSDMGGVIPMDPEEKNEIQKDWVKRNKDQLVITESDVKWTPLSYPTKDLMLFEELTEDKMAIIDAYGLSYYLFSQSKGATFTNVREGMRMTYQDTIIPETEQMYSTISHQLGLTDSGFMLVPDFSHVPVLQENEKEKADVMRIRAEAVQKMIDMGVMTSPDEIRILLGL